LAFFSTEYKENNSVTFFRTGESDSLFLD